MLWCLARGQQLVSISWPMPLFCHKAGSGPATGALNGCPSHTHLGRSVVSASLRPHGLQPTRLLSPWDFPGKNTGLGCHVLLQGNKRPLLMKTTVVKIVVLMLMLLLPLKCVQRKEELSQHYFSSLKKIYWSIVGLQYGVRYRCTAK